jgi:hypothetical protein
MGDPLLSPETVGRILGIGEHTARRLMSRGDIPSRNIGAEGGREQWRTLERYIDQYLASFVHDRATPLTTDNADDITQAADNAQLYTGTLQEHRAETRRAVRRGAAPPR